MTTYWKKKYVCRWPETAFRLAQGDIRKEYGVDISEKAMKGTQIHHDVTEISVDMAEIMGAQIRQAQERLDESFALHRERLAARDAAKTHRAHLRSQDARVIVSDSKVTHYGKDRRQYLAEVELDGARITASVLGVDLTPKQHAVFKKALTTALHEGIVAE